MPKHFTFCTSLSLNRYLKTSSYFTKHNSISRYNFYKKRTYSKIKNYFNLKSNKATRTQVIRSRNSLAKREFSYLTLAPNSNTYYAQFAQLISISYAANNFNRSNLHFFANATNNIKLFSSRGVFINNTNLASAHNNISKFKPKLSDYINKSLIDFLTSVTGSKAIVQFYPFLSNNNISSYRISFYKT